jgi:hypothetical protein
MNGLEFLAAGATYLVIAAALAAGIAASYGRELEANRHPDSQWWVRRLLITPLLVIAATAATEMFGLSKSGAAFTAAMLSIGGYDVLKLIEARWLRKMDLYEEPRAPAAGRASRRRASGGAEARRSSPSPPGPAARPPQPEQGLHGAAGEDEQKHREAEQEQSHSQRRDRIGDGERE